MQFNVSLKVLFVAWWMIVYLKTACPCKNVSSSWFFDCAQVLSLQFQLQRSHIFSYRIVHYLLTFCWISRLAQTVATPQADLIQMNSQTDHNTRLYIQYQHLHSLWNHEESAHCCHKFQKVVGWERLNCLLYLHIHQWSFHHIFVWEESQGNMNFFLEENSIFKTFCILVALFFWTLPSHD